MRSCACLQGSFVHGILQARILEWVAMPSSRGSSPPRDRTRVSCLLHWHMGVLSLCFWKRVFASAFFWQNSISLCPASFYIPRPNLPVTPVVSWVPTFAFQSPIMKMTSFLGVMSLWSILMYALRIHQPPLVQILFFSSLCFPSLILLITKLFSLNI